MAYQDKLKPISQGGYQNKLVPIGGAETPEKKGMSLTNNPLTNIGIGIGSELGRGASGFGELLSKVGGYGARKLGLSKTEKTFKGAGELFKQAKEEVYTKPFEEQRSTVSGKVGEADMGNSDVVIDKKLPTIKFCTCERGKQLKKLIK